MGTENARYQASKSLGRLWITSFVFDFLVRCQAQEPDAASVFTDWGGPFCYQEKVMAASTQLNNIPTELRGPALWR